MATKLTVKQKKVLQHLDGYLRAHDEAQWECAEWNSRDSDEPYKGNYIHNYLADS